jgi:hypothetical protein
MNLKPIFELGLFRQERSGREDKLGGLPFGLPGNKWPSCGVCGRPQVFIAQFRASERLRLGREGRVMFLFQCPDGPLCEAWDPSTGASCALILDHDQLTNSPTDAPKETEVEPEAVIVGWEPVEPASHISFLGDAPAYGPNHVAYKNWENGGRFLMQLIGYVDFRGPPPTAGQTGAEHLHYSGGRYGQDNLRREEPPNPRRHFGRWSRGQSDVPGRPSQLVVRESGEWGMEWANFGGGTAYVFMDDQNDRAFYFCEI